jgi:hypothetical protein
MSKVFRNGKWIEGGKVEVISQKLISAKVFKDGKWVEGQQGDIAVAVAAGNPRDVPPAPPTPPATDADRPRWIAENVRYLEALGEHHNHLMLKAEHPELKGKGWNP